MREGRLIATDILPAASQHQRRIRFPIRVHWMKRSAGCALLWMLLLSHFRRHGGPDPLFIEGYGIPDVYVASGLGRESRAR